MAALFHLSHHLVYNILLTTAVAMLFWLLVYLITTELALRTPVQIIAPL